MEDALISPEGFMILSGAGLIEASADNEIYQHVTERIDETQVKADKGVLTISLSHEPYLPTNKDDNGHNENYAYVMLARDDEIISEPYIPVHTGTVDKDEDTGKYTITVQTTESYAADGDQADKTKFDSVIVDYYTPRTSGAKQIEITADKFGGNYYLEASTLFRAQNGVDMPAEFIIPNCKIQSNFTFTMASSGDPSTFTFTMDAFPDYTRFDHSKKVLAAIQIIEENEVDSEGYRKATVHDYTTSSTSQIVSND